MAAVGVADLLVVGDAADGAQAVEAALRPDPDVVLMDVRMPVLDGLAATRKLLGDRPADRPRGLILTTFDLDDYAADLVVAEQTVKTTSVGSRPGWACATARRPWCRRTSRVWWPPASSTPVPGRRRLPGVTRRRRPAPHAAHRGRTRREHGDAERGCP
ncbi:Response regulator receiver domain-containing protein [Micromonospora citrea]|uniref:Response regulator receiver domain-containing protein n=1 Tax=Micromonospora citrea TaxID=47855 RepID=A0A1C6VUF3_9ACTN|nr:Response regulator receiver domain-containing protein [Micromonospora citrea]